MKRTSGDKATLRWIAKVVKGKKRYVAGLILITVLLGMIGTGYALFLSWLVDSAIAGEQARFWGFAAGLLGLLAFQFILRIIGYSLEEYSRASVENAVKQRLFQCLLSRDYAAVMATHSGEWLNRLTSDAVVVADGVTSILPGLAGTVVRMTCAVTLLIVITPEFGTAFVVAGALVVVLTWGLRKMMKKLHHRVQEADGQLRIHLSERLGSMMILRAFGKERDAMEQTQELMREHKTARMKRNRISSLFHNGFSLAMNGMYVGGAIYCGFGILNGVLSYGTFTAVIQLVNQTMVPIANISGFFPKYATMLASAERLMAAEDFPEPSVGPAVEDIRGYYQDGFEGLSMRKACFTYLEMGGTEKSGSRTVLKDLDLDICKGEYVAFCGPSGCGKSTVLKLLMCMYELDSGSRSVLGQAGQMPLSVSWRGLFAYVPQGNQLMCGTIRQVVTFGDPADMKDDKGIWQALKIACADGFVAELPEGLDTLLGERGAGLSEGQMQRIAIARAIFSQRPILLLDEATSALDESTETTLLDNLRAMTDKTVIIVTHRPKALDITDKIIHFTPPEE